MKKLDIGVLVSGSGTNLQAILDAIARDELPAVVRLVLSNKSDAFALERARAAGVPTRVLSHRDYADREAFDAAMVEALRSAAVEWVVLAGFMRLVTPVFLGAFPWRVINIHPSLLPAFPGVRAVEQALAYGAKVTGCTVHLVDEGTDTGPVILQRAVAIGEHETAEALHERLHAEEHVALVAALQLVAAGRLVVVPGAANLRATVRVLPE